MLELLAVKIRKGDDNLGMSWFIADPHFGHSNILKYESRPFIDTEHMDNAIVENYNRVVNEGDIVYWLGDIFFCKSSRMDYIAKRLTKGRNILIRGNHDRGISNGKFLSLGFKPCKMLYLGGMMLTHEPISEANMNQLWALGIRENVRGHVHSDISDFDPTKYQCVSVENTDYEPISFKNLMNRFKDGEAWRKWSERQQQKSQ